MPASPSLRSSRMPCAMPCAIRSPVAFGSHFLSFRRVGDVGALTEDAWNLRVAGESQATTHHPLICFVRRRNQLLLDPCRQPVTVSSPVKMSLLPCIA